MASSLASGSRSPRASSMPAWAAMAFAVAVLSPVSITDATPRQSLKALCFWDLYVQALDNRPGNRVIGTSRQAGSHLLDCCLITCTPHLPLHQLGFALGDGAGLVQSHGLQEPGVFQVRSALD